MKGFFASVFCLSFLFPAITSSILPRADTPLFYLVSSSNNAANLLPVRISPTGSGFTSLTGATPPAQFYFDQGKLVALQNGSKFPLRSLINAVQQPACSTWGQFTLLAQASSNMCAHPANFQLRSNGQNAQLGAFLTIDFTGGFFACGNSFDIYYRADSTGPPNLICIPVSLYTVPVTL